MPIILNGTTGITSPAFEGEVNSSDLVGDIPAPDGGLTVEQVAAKDVPTGKPYKIVDAADIPTNRIQRNAWAVEKSDLTDGVGE